MAFWGCRRRRCWWGGGGAGWSWLLCGWGCAAIYSCLVASLSLSLTGSVQHFQSLAVESDRGGCCCWIGWGWGLCVGAWLHFALHTIKVYDLHLKFKYSVHFVCVVFKALTAWNQTAFDALSLSLSLALALFLYLTLSLSVSLSIDSHNRPRSCPDSS